MVFTLLAYAHSLQLMDEMCLLFCTYSTVGRHLYGKSQGETYIKPMVIKQVCQAVPDLLHTDLSKGVVMSLLLDETTYCTDKHLVNLILATGYRICYTTTASMARDSDVNNNTVANAIITAWEPLGLPSTRVALVLIDNVGY